MIAFRITVPGKVILFGEHAVVYGKTAVAASLNLRSYLDFTELPLEENFIHVEMQKLQLSKQIPISLVEKSLLNIEFPKLKSNNEEKFYQSIKEFVETIGFDSLNQKLSLEVFFCSLLQIFQEENLKLKPFSIKVNTELSVGAGAGSSASFSVGLVSTFLRWSQLQINSNAPPKFDSKNLEIISQYALNCEKIMHGKPSGIDNNICTFGTIIEFRKCETPKFINTKLCNIKILLVDTKVARSTKVLLNKINGLVNKYPVIFDRILNAIDEVSKQGINIIKQMQALTDNDNVQLLQLYKDLMVLIDINQGLLATCQVSHPRLDLICATAKKYGFSAKLTGAGGGGFAYILIPPDASSTNVQNLTSELTTNEFSVVETNLGGTGVEIHDINTIS